MVIPAKKNSRPTAGRIRIVIYDREEQLYQLQEEWDALLHKISSTSIYLTWEWTISCWNIFGRDCRLFLVTAYIGEELVGLAPLRISHKLCEGVLPYKTLELIPGSPLLLGGDHLDIIVVPEKRSAIIGAMLRSVIAGSWDVLRWESIPAFSPNMGPLAAAFQKGKIKYHIEKASICPYITLPDSWEEYLALQCSAEFRRTIRRDIKKLEREHHFSLIRVDSNQDFSLGLKRLESLHEERWGEKSLFRQEGFRAFHEEVARDFSLRGWLRLYFLSINGKDIAAIYGFHYDTTFFGYQMGWKKDWQNYSVETILLAKVIQQELVQGAKEIDLARGAERYKFHWTSDSRKQVKLTAYRPNWRASLVHFTEYLSEWRAYLVHWGRSIFSPRRKINETRIKKNEVRVSNENPQVFHRSIDIGHGSET